MINEMDENGNGELEFEEFVELMKRFERGEFDVDKN